MTSLVYLLICYIFITVPHTVVGRRREQNNNVNIKEMNKKINDRLDIITNEVKALKDNSPNQAIGGELSLIPLEACRNVTHEGVLLTVRYATDGESEVVAIWSRKQGSGGTSRVVPSNKTPHSRDTFGETQYLTQADSKDVSLLLSTKTVSYILTLYNSNQGNVTLPISAPKIELESSTDLTYFIGQNATFKIKSPNSEMRSGPDSSDNQIRLHFILVDLNTGKYIRESHEKKYVKEIIEKKFFDYVETTFIINTAENNISGLVQVMKDESSSRSNILIGGLLVFKFLTLHPKQQKGPFPSGLMIFGDKFGGAIKEGQTVVMMCSRDEPTCFIHCSVLGSDLKTLKLLKLLPNGTTTLPDIVAPISTSKATDYWQELIAEVLTPQNKEEKRRYKCIAYKSLGKSISHTIVILSVIKTKIDHEESSLIINGQNATLTCAAVGDPLPSVRFDLSYNYNSFEDQDPDDVVVNGDKVIATKHIVYDDGDDKGYYAQSTGKLYSAVCEAEQSIPQLNSNPNYDSFYYPIEN